ncbi:MAG: hypothetical protein PQJ59_16965 [Spirochaetales bacterium]|nr:hypothetical protein [Spirochaetales bacterium]
MDYVKGAIKNALGKEEITPEMIDSVVNPVSVEKTAESLMKPENYKKFFTGVGIKK